MRIMYLIDQTYLHGGIERILSKKANYLVKSGFDVYIVTSEQRNQLPSYDYVEDVNFIDLEVNYNREKSYFHPFNFASIWKHVWSLKKTINCLKPDVIISVSFSPDQYVLPYLGHKNIVKEIHFSGGSIATGLNLIESYLFNRLIGRYKYFVVLNDDEKKYYSFKNMVVVPNFSDSTDINLGESQRKNVILAAGRIAPVKQYDKLLKAWSLIANECPTWVLKIYGDGDDALREDLNALILDLNLSKKVALLRATQDLNKVMRESKIFALSSKTECFPMVLLEAQWCGLACLSFDCPNGPRNIITDGVDGALAIDQNVEDFANKLLHIIRDENIRVELSSNARTNVRRFSEETIMPKWIRLFK